MLNLKENFNYFEPNRLDILATEACLCNICLILLRFRDRDRDRDRDRRTDSHTYRHTDRHTCLHTILKRNF